MGYNLPATCPSAHTGDTPKSLCTAMCQPRQAAVHGGSPGIGRRSRSLDAAPIGIASSGRRVYLLTEGSAPGGGRRLLVRTIEAVPTPVEGIWTDAPQGRMESLPPLEADGRVLGFASAGDRVGVLLETEAGLSVASFERESWTIGALPAGGSVDRADGNSGPALLASTRGFLVVDGAAVFVEDRGGWSVRAIETAPGVRAVGALPDTIVGWRWRAGDADSSQASESDSAGIAEVVLLPISDEGGAAPASESLGAHALPADTSFVGLTVVPDVSGRLIMMLGRRDADDAPMRYAMVEISLSTGDLLYDGPLESVAPVSPEEFKILAAAMVVMMVVSLMIVLRPVPNEAELTIPEGCALASPARRLLATVLDLALCALIVARVSGVPFGEIMGLSVLLRPDDSWLTLPSVLFVGLGYSTAFETVFGATLGKLAMGCRVVRAPVAGGPPRRIGFTRALVRNGVKWILPPAASLALIEPTGRHRGDLIAGVVVVVEPDEPEPDES